MRAFLCFFLFLCTTSLFPAESIGQSPDSTQVLAPTDTLWIPFVAYWDKGESYDFLVTHMKEENKNGVIKKDSLSWHSRFEVVDSTASSYTIRWSSAAFDFGIMEILPDSLIEALPAMDNQGEITYLTDEYGTFVEMLDWEKTAETMKSIFEVTMENVTENMNDSLKAVMNGIIKPLSDVMSSKDYIQNTLLQDILLIHWPLGVELNASHETTYESEFPNLLGGAPFPADGKVSFSHVDEEGGYCVFNNHLKTSGDETMVAVIELLKQMNLPGDDLAKEMKDASLDISEDVYFEYFFYPGIPQLVDYVKTIEIKTPKEAIRKLEMVRVEMLFDEENEPIYSPVIEN